VPPKPHGQDARATTEDRRDACPLEHFSFNLSHPEMTLKFPLQAMDMKSVTYWVTLYGKNAAK
jgi:hypothetical protein